MEMGKRWRHLDFIQDQLTHSGQFGAALVDGGKFSAASSAAISRRGKLTVYRRWFRETFKGIKEMQVPFLSGIFDRQRHDCAGAAFPDTAFHKNARHILIQNLFAGIPKPTAPDWGGHGISSDTKHRSGAW